MMNLPNIFPSFITSTFVTLETKSMGRNYSLLFVWLLCLHQINWINADVPIGCDENMDLVFVLDSSESMIEYDPWGMPYYNWNMVKNFTERIVKDLPIHYYKTRVGFVQYANQPKMVFRLDQYQDIPQIQDAIKTQVNHGGGITFTSEALRFVGSSVLRTDYGDRDNIRDVIIVITDGLSNYDYAGTIPSATDLKRLKPDAEIFTVAVTKYVDEAELKGIASDPSDSHYMQLLDFSLMDYYVSTMVHRVCNLPDPTPPAPKPPQCEVKTDLALLIDNSGSIRDKNAGADNYQLLKEFLVSLVNTLNVGMDTTRVAAVRFSEFVKPVFYLNDYNTPEAVSRAIRLMDYDGGYTNTAEALKVAREQIFQEVNGDRPDVRNVIILITDGESTVNPERTLPEASLTRMERIIIFVVGVTNEVNEDELKGIVTTPIQTHYFNSTKISNLDSIFNQLLRHVCQTDTIQGGTSTRLKRSTSCADDNSCPPSDSEDEIDLNNFLSQDFHPQDETHSTKSGGRQNHKILSLYWMCALAVILTTLCWA